MAFVLPVRWRATKVARRPSTLPSASTTIQRRDWSEIFGSGVRVLTGTAVSDRAVEGCMTPAGRFRGRSHDADQGSIERPGPRRHTINGLLANHPPAGLRKIRPPTLPCQAMSLRAERSEEHDF